MLVLDTNHLREFGKGSEAGRRLMKRLDRANDEVATTIVCIEEQTRGWLAEIRSSVDSNAEIRAYARYQEHVETSAQWVILSWAKESSDLFRTFRSQGVRIPTLDLKIACITIAHEGLLLTRNTVDFAKIPGLKFENWLD
jgi:tRNA(fMet)-specific endonuclease VapC